MSTCDFGSYTSRLLAVFDDHERVILEERLLPQRPKSLAALSERLGAPRARIEQTIDQITDTLRRLTESGQFAPLRWRAEGLATRLGPGLPADSPAVADALGWATHDIPDEFAYIGTQLLLWLAGPYRNRNGVLVRCPRKGTGIAGVSTRSSI